MSAEVIAFPIPKRSPNHGLVRDWLYWRMRNTGSTEASANEWSERLVPSIRDWPEDLALMRKDLGLSD